MRYERHNIILYVGSAGPGTNELGSLSESIRKQVCISAKHSEILSVLLNYLMKFSGNKIFGLYISFLID
jgi:hypothetical protein